MYNLLCLICNEEFHGNPLSLKEFLFKHIHNKQSSIQCGYCEDKSQWTFTPTIITKERKDEMGNILTTQITQYNNEGMIFYWENHKCSEMKLQDIEYEDRELEKEERDVVMGEYRAHTERY